MHRNKQCRRRKQQQTKTRENKTTNKNVENLQEKKEEIYFLQLLNA